MTIFHAPQGPVYLSNASYVLPQADSSKPTLLVDDLPPLERHASEYLCKRSEKVDRFTKLALAAAGELLVFATREHDPARIGLAVGSMFGGWQFAEKELENLYTYGFRKVSPYQATAWFPAAPQGEMTIGYGLLGYAKTLSGGLCCGLEALSVARDALLLGKADVMVAGVCESLDSQIALAGTSDMPASQLSEGACFFLMTRQDGLGRAVSIEINEFRAAETAETYQCSSDEETRTIFDYSPFYLSLQPLLDIAVAARENASHPDRRSNELVFASARRRFVVSLGR